MSKLNFFPSIIDGNNRDKLGLQLSIDENCVRATSGNGESAHYSIRGIDYAGIIANTFEADTKWSCPDGFVGPIRTILLEVINGNFHGGLYLVNKDDYKTDFRTFFTSNKHGSNRKFGKNKGGIR